MKKTISLILSLTLLVTTCLFVFASDTLRGDLDGDGAVAANDLTILARAVGGIEELPEVPEISLGNANTDPVILLPGIMGSELTQDGRIVWPPVLGDDFTAMLRALLDVAALNVNDNPSLPPVRFCMADRGTQNVGSQNTYETLAEAFAAKIGADKVFVFGYDWRLDIADTADDLDSYIDTVLDTTGAKKVNLVAHSMGGLVISGYLAEYGNEKLHTVVTAGTPFLGSQDSVATLKDGGGLLDDYVEDPATAAALLPLVVENARSMPAMYELIPATGWDELGLLEDGELIADATDAQKKAYAFYETVLCRLDEVWVGVDHVGVVGTGFDTTEADGIVNGDGTVTVRSATADGLFVTESTAFSSLHTGLVNDADPVAFIVAAVTE